MLEVEQMDIEHDGLGEHPANVARAVVRDVVAAEQLRSLVERIERLEEERKALSSDIKDIMVEARSAGFDVKVLRQVLRLRKMKPGEADEQLSLLDVYKHALGM